MLSNYKQQLVKKVADQLMVANNTATTLEIKNALRTQYPTMNWLQSDVSETMDEFYSTTSDYTYTDTGSYRVYSLAANPQHFTTPTVVKQPKATTKPTQSKTSRTNAITLIQTSGGKFFGVTFTKKDGTLRDMTCRIDKDDATPTPLGYMNLIDVREKTKKKVNLQTLSELRINKITYKVQ